MTPSPFRVQRRRTKGWTKPEGAVYVGRPTRWANPFVVGEDADDRDQAAALFRAWLEYDRPECLDPYGSYEYRQQMSDRREWMLAHASELTGRDLMCWCPLPAPGEPDHCHAAALLDLAHHGGAR